MAQASKRLTAVDVAPTPLVSWEIPGLNGGSPTNVSALPGRATLIVGANGAGKSALGYWLQNRAGDVNVERMLAHRRLWFESEGPAISAADRQTMASSFVTWNRQPNSRYLDNGQAQRTNVVLYDLMAKINYEARLIADLVYQGVDTDRILDQSASSAIDQLNSILADAGLRILVKLTEAGTFQATNQANGATYGISQMSDGEKSALLLAAQVLTSPDGSILIIDEPERHLHRSISSRLIQAVIAERLDCHAVVLTHDLDLAASMPTETTAIYSLLGCSWSGPNPSGWDLQEVPTSGFTELARRAILGGRTKLMFIEGNSESLDTQLYGLLFPGYTLSPVGSCEQVIRAVTGLRGSKQLHWVDAVGIVDNDGRTPAEVSALAAKGVHVLPVSEIENLYYCNDVVSALAEHQHAAVGRDAVDLVKDAQATALSSISNGDTPDRLAAYVVTATVRRQVVDALPSPTEVQSLGGIPITVTVPSPFPDIQKHIQQLLSSSDIDTLIREFPIKETGLREQVSRTLGFQKRDHYESQARTLISAHEALRQALIMIVGPLPV